MATFGPCTTCQATDYHLATNSKSERVWQCTKCGTVRAIVAPIKPWTVNDRRFLKSLRIKADD